MGLSKKDEVILTKLNAEIIIKGIELQTLLKLRDNLTKPKTPAPKPNLKK